MPKTPNLRDWQPTAGDAKHVDDTPMLNTVAREPQENLTGENSTKEYVATHSGFGELGAKGRK